MARRKKAGTILTEHEAAEGFRPRMVDVGHKPDTRREAIASGRIHMAAKTLERVRLGDVKKGDPIGIAQLAGIMAAKRTADVIPLCHPIRIDSSVVDLDSDDRPDREGLVAITATARVASHGKTGVEMEALLAVSVSLLTVYDVLKAYDPGMWIGEIGLLSKTGGSSGAFKKEAPQSGRRGPR